MGRGRDKRRGKAVEQVGNMAVEKRFRKRFRLSAISTCDREQTPTIFAGPVGVALVVCTTLGPLDSSWVVGLKHAQSCRTKSASRPFGIMACSLML